MAPPIISADFDFLDPDVNLVGLPVAELAHLRESEPIHWVDVPDGCGGFEDNGYWLLTKHADVKEVSRRSERLLQLAERRHPDMAQGDDARERRTAAQRHAQHGRPTPHRGCARSSPAASPPAQSGGWRTSWHSAPRTSPRTRPPQVRATSVEQVSCELPLQAIAGLLGVPQDDRDKLFRWSNEMTGGEDPEFADVDPAQSSMELIMYAMAMADERGKNPTDDIVTTLIEADIDGRSSPTTSSASSSSCWRWLATRPPATRSRMNDRLREQPDQWELYKKERPSTAADEIVRWATPVTAFQRTTNEDTELNGVQMKKGQRLVMS